MSQDCLCCTASTAIATLAEAMCPDSENGSITDFTPLDGCVGENPDSAANTFSLAGKQGQKVFLHYDQGASTWHIVQVQHEELTVIVDHVDNGQCVEVLYQGVALARCDDAVAEDLICGVDCSPSSGSSAN
jgi:hypothetical protein